MIIAVDFDGTIVEHEFPNIGPAIPGAFEWMRRWQEAGAKLILWTMRSAGRKTPGLPSDVLNAAVELCRANGVDFFGVNSNPAQHEWTQSPKAYAHCYVDDAGFGCPLIVEVGKRPYVDWAKIGPAILRMIEGDK